MGASIDIRFNELADVEIEMDRAVPLALVICELLTNTVKYAFIGQSDNQIALSVLNIDQEIRVLITDNGVGLPNGFNVAGSKGFGMKIVESLVKQLSGNLNTIEQDHGAGFMIRFPLAA